MSDGMSMAVSVLAIAISTAAITLAIDTVRRDRAERRRREDAKRAIRQNVFEIRDSSGRLIGRMRGKDTQ